MAILGTIVPAIAIAPQAAQALPEAQIIDKLQKVPVFTIANNTGNFLQQSVTASGTTRTIIPVFMESKDADVFTTADPGAVNSILYVKGISASPATRTRFPPPTVPRGRTRSA